MMGEVGILRLCGWVAIILEWIVVALPPVLLLLLALIGLGWVAVGGCAVIGAVRGKWYTAMEKIAEGIKDEDTEE